MMRHIGFLAPALCLGVVVAAAQAPPPTPQFTLAEAQARAQANSPDFQAALVAEGVARGDTTQARAGLLPSLSFNNSYIYTQGLRYIANNAIHEYLSQGNLHESLDFGAAAGLKRAQAGEALARAQAEIAARGLAATVTAGYYGLVAAGRKLATAQQGLDDAQKYLTISQERERGGEVAHADVIKAQLEVEQRQRELTEAGLAQTQARLELAVLLFPRFDQNFTVADDLDQAPALPPADQVQALAAQHNPILAAANANAAQARQEVGVARAGLLPALTLDYFYGIDAAQFAARNEFGQPNLGSSAVATLNFPLFNWGANRARLQQSELRQQQAGRELSYTQRQLQANLQSFYTEAQAARAELTTLARSRDGAAESLRLTGLAYANGEATILELVDAQTANTAARNAYDDGQVRYRVALAALKTLTGSF